MEELRKILRKGGYLNVHKVKSCKKRYELIKKELTDAGVPCLLTDDFSFFRLEVIAHSLKNKQAMEEAYESLRRELFEVWEHFEYNERKACVDEHMKQATEKLDYFLSAEGKIIRNAFFDELLNTLYENEMMIFEKPQFFQLEKHFASRMISPDYYAWRPYEAGYASCTLLAHDDTSYLLFSDETKTLYQHFLDGKTLEWSFDPRKEAHHFTRDVLTPITQAILLSDERTVVQAFLDCGLCSPYIDGKLRHYLKRLHKKEQTV